MPTQTFADKQGTVNAAWLNEIDSYVYRAGLLNPLGSTFGAVGDGVTDDSVAIQAALTAGSIIIPPGKTFKVTNISIPADRTIMQLGDITGGNAANPIFKALNGASHIRWYGSGVIQGSGTYALFLEGTTNTPTLQAHYASEIELIGLRVSSSTITTAIGLSKAVKSLNIYGANLFSLNGINCNAAGVEVCISDSIIYGAVGAAGSTGIKLRSAGGTVYYNQGWLISGCTIDNFEICHDISDVFVYTVEGSYTGVAAALAATSGYAFQFQAPTNTNLTEVISVDGGSTVGGRIRFASSGGGQAYNARIDATFTGVPGTAVAIENNAANIDVKGKFKAGSGTAVGVVGSNNNAGITAGGDFDSTYTNGVVLNGANGANCVIGPISGPTSGDLIGAGRANILCRGVPQHSSGVVGLNRAFSAANLGAGATYAVGVAISTQAVGFARGETGDIVINLSFSGATAATQNVQIGVPAGMVLASGTGWSAANLYLGAATGLLSVRIPYTCTADGSGNVTVTNQAGATLTINNQGYCGVVRNWA